MAKSLLSRFDAMSSGDKKDGQRPRPTHNSKSYNKAEAPSPTLKSRPSRASTISTGPLEYKEDARRPLQDVTQRSKSAAFAKLDGNVDEHGERVLHEEPGEADERPPSALDDLPIELISLTDSFIDSLSAKVHPTPPTVDKLSGLFQDFYALAATHINTHIATLSSQQHRKNSSPAPSISSRSSVASNFRAKAASISSKDAPKPTIQRRDSEQQMLTAEEIAGRKRARRLLEHKKVALEEIVERRVCERIYDRIWRHRSTQDEAQDEKLRSKTAALAVVGIGLGDLGITLGKDASGKSGAEMEQEVRAWLEGARQELVLMNDRKYPLGKLQHLKAAHKGIVDTLSHFHPSSSADEIMPMLIYTLITSPAEGINVMSNLFFIQRFRDENKIDGEAAYCLTNLEAAITFLETVDLASLRADESPSGPPKSASRPTTPGTERSNPHDLAMTPSITAPSLSPAVIDPTTANTAVPQQGSSTSAQESLRPGVKTHKRRLSDLLQPPAQAFSTASDAMLSTADQSFKTINASLGNSYNFLLGKLKERQENITEGSANLVVPKTLDDARRLITTPPPEEDGSTASGASSIHTPEDKRVDDKVLSLLVGKRPAREQSVDSSRSAGSGRKVSFMENATPTASPLSTSTSGNNSSGTTALSSNPAMVIGENLRSLGNSLNPIGRFAGFGSGGMMKGFGRTTQAANDIATNAVSGGDGVPDHGVAELTAAHPHLTNALPPKEVKKVAPPIKRFMDIQNPGELRINEVLELLRDYRRLAGVVKNAGLC